MDALGDEVSSKIRLAIKTKLQELNAYVDDELPDYIMVMVANKKGGDVMRRDLGLFLNERTDDFVDWLVGVLDRLEKVTLGGKAKKKLVKKKKSTPSGGKTKEEKDKKKKKSKTATPTSGKKADKKRKDEGDKKGKRRSSSLTKKRKASRSVSPERDDRQSEGDRQPEGDRAPPPPPRRGSRSRSRERHHLDDRRHHGRERGDGHLHLSRDPREEYGEYDARRYREPPSQHQQHPRDHREHGRDGGGDYHHHHHARRRTPSPELRRREERGRDDRGRDDRGRERHHGHDQQQEGYDPEKLLKRAVSSTVNKVPKKDEGRGSSSNLVLKAVADADRSIRRHHRDDRPTGGRRGDDGNADELEAIHAKRQRLSEAMRQGQLNEQKIKEINKSLKPKRQESPPPPQRKKRRSSPPPVEKESPSKKRRSKEDQAKVESKKKRIEVDVDSLGSADLRHRLGIRRGGSNDAGQIRDAKLSGLKVQIKNDRSGNASEDEREVDEQRSKLRMRREVEAEEEREKEVQRRAKQRFEEGQKKMRQREESSRRQADAMSEEDRKLERMRQRALQSMSRGRRESSDSRGGRMERYSPTATAVQPHHEKKIIIPLNEDTSDEEDTDVEDGGRARDTPDGRTSSSDGDDDSSSSDGDSSSEGDDGASDKEDPTFIVTLEGIDKEYFKQGQQGKKEVTVQPTTTAVAVSSSNKTRPILKGATGATSAVVMASVLKTQEGKEAAVSLASARRNVVEGKKKEEQQVKPKPTAPVAPMEIRVKPEAKAINRPIEQTQKQQKKPEAKVAPLNRRPPPTPEKKPKPSDPAPAPQREKPKRARITAPEPDGRHDTSRDSASSYSRSHSDSASAASGDVCRFWPNCSRGDKCFYLHPSSSSSSSGGRRHHPPPPPPPARPSSYAPEQHRPLYSRYNSAPAVDRYHHSSRGHQRHPSHHHHSSRSYDGGRDKFKWTSASALPF